MSEERIVLNGINALTGEYLVPPMTLAEATAWARGTPPPVEHVKPLNEATDRILSAREFALPIGTNANALTESGWAVVFTPDTPAAVRQALQPLLERRRNDTPALFKELEYRPGESREEFLGRYGAHGSDVEPELVPFFLLLVGGPEAIPFEIEFLLTVDYAVGRLAFDRVEDYGRYAEAVVAYETAQQVANGREVVFWGTQHDADAATELSSESLIRPLIEGVPAQGSSPRRLTMMEKFNFRTLSLRGEGQATKANLLGLLHSRQQALPSLLFTASHGMGGWPKGDARERSANGALLCQDWPGFGRIKPEHYLTAAEIEPDARLNGLVAFVFACYGAGTPKYDPFLRKPAGGPVEVAEAPFVSALAQRLLASGALAVIGHVERAWGYSIKPRGVGPQLQPFNNLIGRILSGERVGNAPLDFNQRYATYSVNLLRLLDPSLPAAHQPTDPQLVQTWIERNDAQNYVVLGDPAACLRVDDLA
jgi:hypothetical protein